MTVQTPGCGSNSEARKRETPLLDGCGYPEGVTHAHVDQCHRAERRSILLNAAEDIDQGRLGISLAEVAETLRELAMGGVVDA